MTDKIRINGLFLRTIIGINHDEREHKQDVMINLSLDVDTRPAARTDQIDDAVDSTRVDGLVTPTTPSSYDWNTHSSDDTVIQFIKKTWIILAGILNRGRRHRNSP